MRAKLKNGFTSQPQNSGGAMELFNSQRKPLWWRSLPDVKRYVCELANEFTGELVVYTKFHGDSEDHDTGWRLSSTNVLTAISGNLSRVDLDITAYAEIRVTYENTDASPETTFAVSQYVTDDYVPAASA